VQGSFDIIGLYFQQLNVGLLTFQKSDYYTVKIGQIMQDLLTHRISISYWNWNSDIDPSLWRSLVASGDDSRPSDLCNNCYIHHAARAVYCQSASRL